MAANILSVLCMNFTTIIWGCFEVVDRLFKALWEKLRGSQWAYSGEVGPRRVILTFSLDIFIGETWRKVMMLQMNSAILVVFLFAFIIKIITVQTQFLFFVVYRFFILCIKSNNIKEIK